MTWLFEREANIDNVILILKDVEKFCLGCMAAEVLKLCQRLNFLLQNNLFFSIKKIPLHSVSNTTKNQLL